MAAAATTEEICELCSKEKSKYVCPKCNIPYCSVQCYKAPAHLKCSEEFFKNCIQEELSSAAPQSKDDMQQIYQILKRMREADAGFQPQDFDDNLDSDDEQPEQAEEAEDSFAQFEEDMAKRLEGVDLNDADEVWERLTESEKQEFQGMVDSGDILKLLPDYKPWWVKKPASKIVVVDNVEEQPSGAMPVPQIAANIPPFAELCKKPPSPCLHYNLWNILAAYASVVRFFSGEQLSNPIEAAAHLVNLSLTLKCGTNFEDADDAIISVEMEDLTTSKATENGASISLVKSREQLQQDTRQLMGKSEHKLAALSDILQLLQVAKQLSRKSKGKEAEFQKLYALCLGSAPLEPKKLQLMAKKIEFLLAYVKSQTEVDLN